MSLRVTSLRAVNVNDASAMNLHVAQLEDLHAQAMRDLQIMSDSGEQVTDLVAQLSNLANEITVLKGDVQTTPDDVGAVEAWHAQADALNLKVRHFVDMTAARRSRSREGAQFVGLYWGVGAAAVITVAAYFIWRGRKYRRRG